jgi:pimeloyl-ACP methyl ester carboxylesterase
VTDRLPPGPYRELKSDQAVVPLYIIPFDKRGLCQGPGTKEHLVDAVRGGDFTDIYLFSHGWNDTFQKATGNYEKFFDGFVKLREPHGLPVPDPYHPLLLGIVWPAIDFLLPWEHGPQFAAGGTDPSDDLIANERSQVDEIAADLPPAEAARFYQLSQQQELDAEQARELAAMLAPRYPTDPDELGADATPVTPDELVQVWAELGAARGEPADADDWGTTDETGAEPKAAGLFRFDPRDIVRAFTVYKMKDRAGVVGSAGVGPLLHHLLEATPSTKLHIIGHSYGCKVLLSALCHDPLPRKVESALLLEPAINYLCFARQVPKVGKPGGYRAALDRVAQPILSTFSSRDIALHDLFHLAVRRGSDLGEMKIAALGVVPSIYCALGGWGPGGLDADEAREVSLKEYPDRYALAPGTVKIYGVNSSEGISGHSDVINERTFWALYNQVVPSR